MPPVFLAGAPSAALALPLPNAEMTGSGNVTLAQITSADWSLMLDSTAAALGLATGVGSVVQGLGDIGQCVMIILGTPKGSDPLRPTFGCDLWHFIDMPLTLAVPHVVREVTEALILWEPRIKVLAVTVAVAPEGANSQYGANLNICVTWQPRLAGSVRASVLQENVTVVTVSPGLGA